MTNQEVIDYLRSASSVAEAGALKNGFGNSDAYVRGALQASCQIAADYLAQNLRLEALKQQEDEDRIEWIGGPQANIWKVKK